MESRQLVPAVARLQRLILTRLLCVLVFSSVTTIHLAVAADPLPLAKSGPKGVKGLPLPISKISPPLGSSKKGPSNKLLPHKQGPPSLKSLKGIGIGASYPHYQSNSKSRSTKSNDATEDYGDSTSDKKRDDDNDSNATNSQVEPVNGKSMTYCSAASSGVTFETNRDATIDFDYVIWTGTAQQARSTAAFVNDQVERRLLTATVLPLCATKTATVGSTIRGRTITGRVSNYFRRKLQDVVDKGIRGIAVNDAEITGNFCEEKYMPPSGGEGSSQIDICYQMRSSLRIYLNDQEETKSVQALVMDLLPVVFVQVPVQNVLLVEAFAKETVEGETIQPPTTSPVAKNFDALPTTSSPSLVGPTNAAIQEPAKNDAAQPSLQPSFATTIGGSENNAIEQSIQNQPSSPTSADAPNELQSQQQDQHSAATSTGPSGGFVAGLVLVVVFGVLAFGTAGLMYQRRQRRKRGTEEEVQRITRSMDMYSLAAKTGDEDDCEQDLFPILSLAVSSSTHPDNRLTNYRVTKSDEEPVLNEDFEVEEDGRMFVRRKFCVRTLRRKDEESSCFDEFDNVTVVSDTHHL